MSVLSGVQVAEGDDVCLTGGSSRPNGKQRGRLKRDRESWLKRDERRLDRYEAP